MIQLIEEYKQRLRDCGDSGGAELNAMRSEALKDLEAVVGRYANAGVFHDTLMACKSMDGLAWRRAAVNWMVVCRALVELPGALEKLMAARRGDEVSWPFLHLY